MPRKVKIAGAAIGVLLFLCAGAAFAWDQAEGGKVPSGVTVSGVGVGDMSRGEAREAIREGVQKPLEKPLIVTWNEAEFKLAPERAELGVDVDGAVEEALALGEDGSFISRSWRRVTGGEVNTALTAPVSWSGKRVKEFVAAVAAEVDREPRNATIEPEAGRLTKLHSSAGLKLREDELIDAINAELGQGSVARVEAVTDRIQPDVRTRDLAAQTPHYITVDRTSNILRYFSGLKLQKEYRISVGAIGFETPAGLYHIQNKAIDPAWHVPEREWAGKLAGKVIPGGVPQNPLKARWMGFYDGAGIHGTSEVANLGAPASHGCIRMSVVDVTELYDLVPTGTPIFIA